MDTVAALAFARALIDIDSTTGKEAAAGAWLASALRDLGYQVVEQPVEGDRFNVLAAIDKPQVVLSTHFDCVPPFFPSSVRDGNLYGRGSCDAKGILAAQVAAAGRLRAEGNTQVGLLFVVGEERGSDGAAAANRSAPGSRFLVNGEPTSSQVATGTRGILRVRLRASGRAGHSSVPEHFESAIEKLLDALVGLRRLPLPRNDIFGATSYCIGLIEGGVAPNVVPADASAEVMFRTVSDADEVLQAVRTLEPLVRVEEVLRVPPVQLTTVPGIPSASFPFTTDIPLLDRWGAPLLYGPGSFLVAHTDDEHLSLAEFEASIDGYISIVRALISGR
jgi:acetylornithine deacetylase